MISLGDLVRTPFSKGWSTPNTTYWSWEDKLAVVVRIGPCSREIYVLIQDTGDLVLFNTDDLEKIT